MTLSGLLIFGWIPSLSFRLKRAVRTSVHISSTRFFILFATEVVGHLRDAFLCPVKIFFDLFCRLHPIREIGTGSFKPPLSKRLQFKQLLLLRIESARSVILDQSLLLLLQY